MQLTSEQEIYDKLEEFLDENESIVKSLAKSGKTSDINDWGYMKQMHAILNWGIRMDIIVNYDFQALIYNVENEKDRFEVQKVAKNREKDFEKDVDSIIKRGRTWEFEDYRCIDWQKRLTEFMCSVKEFYWCEE